MSWTDVFPVADDDLIDRYQDEATAVEKTELDGLFAVKEILNPKPEARHIVAASLFWKQAWLRHGKLPVPTRRKLMKAQQKGYVKRHGLEPWNHYVEPLLDGAEKLSEEHPEIAFRVYLAGDLEFLVPDLIEVGCEIYLMEHNSIAHNPGAMWRLLALEEQGKLITLTDSDRARDVIYDIERTESLTQLGLGFWRIPTFGEIQTDENYRQWNNQAIGYRPVMLCQLGCRVTLPTGDLMKALIWLTRKGHLSPLGSMPGCGELPIYGFVWPDYGFDEWFAITTLFPRMAEEGILTFVPSGLTASLLPLDIEYVTWANPDSEMLYFGSAQGCCAGGVNDSIMNFTPEEFPTLLSKLRSLFQGTKKKAKTIAPSAAQSQVS